MKIRGRIYSVILVLLLVLFVWLRGVQDLQPSQGSNQPSIGTGMQKETLYVWYTDEALTDYMNSMALSYMEAHDNIRIVPTLVSAVEYVESINQATMQEQAMPDLCLISNDSLEKVYLAGLPDEITDPEQIVTEENFPQAALHAVTYQDKLLAYPFYYETSLLLYNQTYLDEMAANKIEALKSQQEAGEEVGIEITGGSDLIPKTVDDILNLADAYDAPDGVESILKWDVSDIFYNYFFAGNYMDIGGENGDDASICNIHNENTTACLQMYQSLNQFFSIEAKEADYDTVLQEFIDGRTLFTVVTTDAIARLEAAKADGSLQGEYGMAMLPDVSADLKSRGLSVTNGVIVNGYGHHKEDANAFASYLTGTIGADFYDRTGKLTAHKNVSYENDKPALAMQAYEKSVSLPKIMQVSNFWVQLERTLTGIWEGEDADQALQSLQEQMDVQLQK